MPELPIVVLGMPTDVVPDADLLVGGRRHLDGRPGRHLLIAGDLGPVLDRIQVRQCQIGNFAFDGKTES